jgi:hypothetical protein
MKDVLRTSRAKLRVVSGSGPFRRVPSRETPKKASHSPLLLTKNSHWRDFPAY